MPSFNELVQQNLNYAKVCTSQQRKLKMLQEKLDSLQEAYKILLEQYEIFANLNIELSTKIEQLEASATTNACTINNEQLSFYLLSFFGQYAVFDCIETFTLKSLSLMLLIALS